MSVEPGPMFEGEDTLICMTIPDLRALLEEVKDGKEPEEIVAEVLIQSIVEDTNVDATEE